jgi:uncharacterized protein YndB with AHSA1/START domain
MPRTVSTFGVAILPGYPAMEIEKTIVIARPIQEVWDYIADPRNDHQWCEKVEGVHQEVGDGPGPDARYRVVHRPVRLKGPKDLAVSVQEYSPPSRLRLREEDDDGVFNVTYELEAAGKGTRLTQRDRIEWKIPRFQYPIARRMVSRDIANQFSALKRRLEGGG